VTAPRAGVADNADPAIHGARGFAARDGGDEMNVFVLCTGRCGSTTFGRACAHITNYSSAHESRTPLLGADRFRYPPRHIEVDNRLSWLLGRLDRAYGDDAFYVHLRRDDADTATSFVARYGKGIIKAYRGSGILMGLPEATDPMAVALDYCDTVNANIEAFLKDKSRTMKVRLERGAEDFRDFCSRIGAEVDLEVAVREFELRHNATRPVAAGGAAPPAPCGPGS
jgi:hypothetical protein